MDNSSLNPYVYNPSKIYENRFNSISMRQSDKNNDLKVHVRTLSKKKVHVRNSTSEIRREQQYYTELFIIWY